MTGFEIQIINYSTVYLICVWVFIMSLSTLPSLWVGVDLTVEPARHSLARLALAVVMLLRHASLQCKKHCIKQK